MRVTGDCDAALFLDCIRGISHHIENDLFELGSIGLVGVFTLLLVKALVWAVVGFLVIRRATPR